MELSRKVAIVTGGGGPGTGRAVSRRLALEGATVVVADVDEMAGQETIRAIAASGGSAEFARVDVGVEDEVRQLVEHVETTLGGIDVLVNNASAPFPSQGLLRGWFDAVQVDLLGTMYSTWHAIPSMRRRGAGAIVNISSTSALGHGYKASPSPGYDVAKAGVLRLATMLAPLAEQDKIRVNCLLPDWVATPELVEYCDSLTPEQRVARGVPAELTSLEEISDAVFELITDDGLAGRVMVWWSGEPRRLIPLGDRGHEGWQ